MRLKTKFILGTVLALASLVGVACNVKATIALVLDGLAVACDEAAPFAGPYGPFLILAADFAQMGAKELESTDPAATQIAIIAAGARTTLAQAGNLNQADTKVKEAEAALQAVADFCTIWQSQQGAVVAHTSAPIVLTDKDKTALVDVSARVAHVHLLLGK